MWKYSSVGSCPHLVFPNFHWCFYSRFSPVMWSKLKKLGYARWLLYKQPRQESDSCCFPFAHHSAVFHSPVIRRAFYGDAMFVPFGSERHKHGSRWVFLLKTNLFSLELWHIEINAFSSASSVYLAKPKEITHLLNNATVFSGRYFHVTQRKCSITKRTLSS